jgi:hypothetical protein
MAAKHGVELGLRTNHYIGHRNAQAGAPLVGKNLQSIADRQTAACPVGTRFGSSEMGIPDPLWGQEGTESETGADLRM